MRYISGFISNIPRTIVNAGQYIKPAKCPLIINFAKSNILMSIPEQTFCR